jgi:hypothetical protein
MDELRVKREEISQQIRALQEEKATYESETRDMVCIFTNGCSKKRQLKSSPSSHVR